MRSFVSSAFPSSYLFLWVLRFSLWRSDSYEAQGVTHDILILCAAGMLVSAFLMVGQKALFTAIRLYGAQSLLLAIVAVTMAVSAGRPAHE